MALRERVFLGSESTGRRLNLFAHMQHRVSSLLIRNSELRSQVSGFEVSVDLPDGNRLSASGSSTTDALNQFYAQVAAFAEDMVARPSTDAAKARTAFAECESLIDWLQASGRVIAAKKNATKTRQKTIGVSSKRSLIDAIGKEGDSDRFAVLAREAFGKGFRALERRLDLENSEEVFRDFQRVYESFRESPVQQWPLRLDPKNYGRVVVRAKEYGKSLSSLAALCLAYGLRA